MAANDVQIDFNAPAVLKKWPSLKSERFQQARHPDAYLLVDGTLDECIREFMTKPASQRHLYEIHTAPQQPLVSAVLSPEHIVEIARLRDWNTDSQPTALPRDASKPTVRRKNDTPRELVQGS